MRTCSQKNIEENLRRTEAGFHPECEPTDIDAQSPLAFNLKTEPFGFQPQDRNKPS